MWLVSSSASIDDSVMKESSLFISGLKQKGEQRAEDMRRLIEVIEYVFVPPE